ncbi:MAG: hypothetical protein Q8K65_03430 [Alphaproteobacteria bacterium]|nr:hypothetical protein [Alphaproteobacteria bacterium]
MSSLLKSTAVGRRSEADASEILSAYIAQAPAMVLNHTAEVAPAVGQAPKGTAAGDQFEPK